MDGWSDSGFQGRACCAVVGSGGVARAELNHRLGAVIPAGWVFRPFRAGDLLGWAPGALPRSITFRLVEAGLCREACGEGG